MPSSATKTTATRQPDNLIQVGWIFAVDSDAAEYLNIGQRVGETVLATLQGQLPNFEWKLYTEHRRRFSDSGQLDPLPLLELGVQLKLRNGWDYAFVVVPNELLARDRPRTLGVPSSALETMVISLAPFMSDADATEKTTAIGLHLFGHLMGLNHLDETPMEPPPSADLVRLRPFTPEQLTQISARLHQVADSRLEERPQRPKRLAFYWQSLRADPFSIIKDVWQYRPWRLPLRLGRLTATTTVTLLLLLIAAESWEVGTQLSPLITIWGTLLVIVVATLLVFVGKNLGEVSRGIGMREQLVRTRIVVFVTLLFGIATLWLVLFTVSFLGGSLLPRHVIANWSGVANFGTLSIMRQAAFMAMLGVLAGSLGGNLENEDELKADLFFDEET